MRTAQKGIALLVLLATVLAVTGCQSQATRNRPVADFQVVGLKDGPAELAALLERMKGTPGLYVLPDGDEAYLLLVAGLMDRPGMQVEVFDVQQPVGGSKEVRIGAVVRAGDGDSRYAYTVLQLTAAADVTYKARLSLDRGQVIELTGTKAADR